MTPRTGPVLALILVACVACDGCSPTESVDAGKDPAPEVGRKPSVPVVAHDSTPRHPLPQFVNIAKEAGVEIANHTGKPQQKDWIASGMGGGSIVLDYDADGDMDLCFVDGTMITEKGVMEYDPEWRTRLFRNDGGMKFTDVTEEAGIDIQAFGFGGASCDYDADGFPDIHISAWGRNYLLHNNGDGTFEDVTAAAGVLGDPRDMSTACAWGDLDGDGIHDLYVSNYLDQWWQIEKYREDYTEAELHGRRCDWRGYMVYCGPLGLPAQADRLYLGNGDGTFREVGEERLRRGDGSVQDNRCGFTPVMTDVDNDGDLDIYVANDTQSNFLWVNDGKGHFVDMGLEAGVAMNRDVIDQAGMGVDAADLNRDGRIDLIVTNFSHDYNTLYLNYTKGKRPSFRDLSHNLKVAKLAYLRLCWGTRLLDYDNDGELDMFVACGHVYGEIANFPDTGTSYEQKCLLLRNLGPPKYAFEDVTDRSGAALQLRRVWRGAAFADFDDDGDQDIFITALNDISALCRNDGGNANAYLRFRLSGPGMQRDPSGARVYVHTPEGRVLMEELHHGASFCSDNDPRLFFGLGGYESVPKVVVRWPGGEEQTFENVETSKLYRVTHGQAELVLDEWK